jgi:hypothetical protein
MNNVMRYVYGSIAFIAVVHTRLRIPRRPGEDVGVIGLHEEASAFATLLDVRRTRPVLLRYVGPR